MEVGKVPTSTVGYMENKTNKNIYGLLLTLNDLLFLVDVSSDVGIFGVLSAIKRERKIRKENIIYVTTLLIIFKLYVELFL